MEEEFCDLLRTVDSTERGSLCYNEECWAVSLVHPYKPILETLTVTHRYLQREGLPHLPILVTTDRQRNSIFTKTPIENCCFQG